MTRPCGAIRRLELPPDILHELTFVIRHKVAGVIVFDQLQQPLVSLVSPLDGIRQKYGAQLVANVISHVFARTEEELIHLLFDRITVVRIDVTPEAAASC
jgi:hypothetical protein